MFNKASAIFLAPSFSALFLAMAHLSKLGVPTFKASDKMVTPSIPNPQLFIKKTFNELALDK